MMLVVFLLGQVARSLTVKWIMSLDRNKPLSTMELVLLAPTRRGMRP
jgi:hypothetical protein